MDLTRNAKKGLLFGDEKNQVLIDIVSFERGKEVDTLDSGDVLRITGLQRPTLDNWRKGKNMKVETLETAIKTTREYLDAALEQRKRRGILREQDEKEYKRLSDALGKFAAAVLREDVSVYDVAEILGMATKTCQQTLDDIIFSQWSMFPSILYDKRKEGARETEDLADEHLERYEGVYLAHVRRDNLWLQAPLRVRYLQELAKGLFIRCKMNFPIINPAALAAMKTGEPPKYWEMDGALTVREHNLYWIFEKRQSHRNDHFYFITGTQSTTKSKHLTLSGSYLTTGQDTRQSIVSGEILIHRLFSDDGKDPLHLAYRDIMWHEVKVLTSKPELDLADRRWEQYRTRYARDDGK